MHKVPVWRLIAEQAHPQRALVVAGYRRGSEADTDMAERFRRLSDSGVTAVKIAADGSYEQTSSLLQTIRDTGLDNLDLAVDLGYAATVPAAANAARSWQEFGLLWVEDPFPSAEVRQYQELRAATSVPIGAGDEATPSELLGLINHDAVEVLRMDTTTVGGITGALLVADRTDRRISFHVYPEIHRHLAWILDQVNEVEMFLPGDPFDFADRFIKPASPLRSSAGVIEPVNQPGLGIRYQPDDVTNHVTKSATFGQRQRRQ